MPNLESFNIIKLNANKNLALNNIYLQYYRNKNGNEQLYALDQSIQTLYIIGDSENWKTKTKLVKIWNLVVI